MRGVANAQAQQPGEDIGWVASAKGIVECALLMIDSQFALMSLLVLNSDMGQSSCPPGLSTQRG